MSYSPLELGGVSTEAAVARKTGKLLVSRRQWLVEGGASGDWPCGRSGHTAVCDDAGENMFVFGGYYDRRCVNDMYRLHIPTMTWTCLECTGDIPKGVASHTAVMDGTYMFVFGGSGFPFGHNNRRGLFMLDTQTLVWTQLHYTGKVPAARYGHSMSLSECKGYIYIYGGTSGHVFFDDCLRYCLRTREMSEIETHVQLMPRASLRAQQALLSQPLRRQSQARTDPTQRITPRASTVRAMNPNSPPPTYKHVSVVYNNTLYVLGGGSPDCQTDTQLLVYALDFATNTWSLVPVLGESDVEGWDTESEGEAERDNEPNSMQHMRFVGATILGVDPHNTNQINLPSVERLRRLLPGLLRWGLAYMGANETQIEAVLNGAELQLRPNGSIVLLQQHGEEWIENTSLGALLVPEAHMNAHAQAHTRTPTPTQIASGTGSPGELSTSSGEIDALRGDLASLGRSLRSDGSASPPTGMTETPEQQTTSAPTPSLPGRVSGQSARTGLALGSVDELDETPEQQELRRLSTIGVIDRLIAIHQQDQTRNSAGNSQQQGRQSPTNGEIGTAPQNNNGESPSRSGGSRGSVDATSLPHYARGSIGSRVPTPERVPVPDAPVLSNDTHTHTHTQHDTSPSPLPHLPSQTQARLNSVSGTVTGPQTQSDIQTPAERNTVQELDTEMQDPDSDMFITTDDSEGDSDGSDASFQDVVMTDSLDSDSDVEIDTDSDLDDLRMEQEDAELEGNHSNAQHSWTGSVRVIETTADGEVSSLYPTARRSHTCCVHKNKIYICGGTNGKDSYTDMWALNMDTLRWEKVKAKGLLPIFFHTHVITSAGQVLLYGGRQSARDETRVATVSHIWVDVPSLKALATMATNACTSKAA